ncbi:cysteine-rich repeat secretory protein 60 isoform X1 [Ananas comosus]|uniref:Cysteine-rich repeat secretory protein 60 isoform X1 n=1 Tax=Ananas comosus TaxID=4615 RepID=A0A6P5F226_ANACO|nr:cysteine-rich repeat secretory protein 60 isoform X1 [Ananas comosus]
MAKLSVFLLSLLLFSFLIIPSASAGDDYTAFVYAGCSQPQYAADTAYAYSADSVLTTLANAAAFGPYANSTSGAVSGVLQCRADLPLAVCAACVRSALSELSTLCPSAAAAAVQLRACFLRYGNDSFLGRQDTSLLYKKCGAPAPPANSADFLGMRDASLGALVTAAAPGGYRVGGAGYVQAMSQCVGDIGPKQCTDCVAAAVTQLKSWCDGANAGEAYLGKCYARFWSNGGTVYSPAHEDHVDEAGKTLAIIIGLMAAVALIIVFLSFIRRAGNGK